MKQAQLLDYIKSGKNELLQQEVNNNPTLAVENTELGISLLQYAAYCRNITAVNILREHVKEMTIYEAASIGDITTIKKYLQDNPGLVNSYSVDGFTPLGLASFFNQADIVELLLEKGADPNIATANDFKVAPLHSACATSDIEIARLLIANGADVNKKQMAGVTPLHSAAHNGQTELVKLLLQNGADVNAITDNEKTPLAMAEERDFTETAHIIRTYATV